MDIDVFPNSLEYWGPNAMVFFRNNFTDGFSSDDTRLQFSAKYNFGLTYGGN